MHSVAATLTALALAASAASPAAVARSEHAVTAPRVGRAGVTVALPKGWHAWVPPGPYAPGADPLTRVVAVSAPFRFAASGCQVAGTDAASARTSSSAVVRRRSSPIGLAPCSTR